MILGTTLCLNACQRGSDSVKYPTNPDLGDPSLSLQSIKILPVSGQVPTRMMVCLHGWGANSEDLAPLAPALNFPEYQFLFPDAPLPHPAVAGGKMWYNLETANYQGLAESRQSLTDWLKSLESSTGIPLSETILGGFSQGGAMALDVGLTLPLAGIVCLSGYLHSKPEPSIGNSLPPVLIVHGKQDPVVPLAAAQNARNTLTALGIKVNYQEFNMGHEIRPEVLTLISSFIREIL